jgi:hypothetical protein
MNDRGKTAVIGTLISGIPIILATTAIEYRNSQIKGIIVGIVFYVVLVTGAWYLGKRCSEEDVD